ncbi:TPA: hypothetical protein JDD75_002177 [Salmonella enterica subsp. houtenae]|nr:hypothetical protein [Salmonella enterica subsp. houtenae]
MPVTSLSEIISSAPELWLTGFSVGDSDNRYRVQFCSTAWADVTDHLISRSPYRFRW